MKTTNYSDLEKNLAGYMDQAARDHAPLIITRQGAAPMVLLSLEDYGVDLPGVDMAALDAAIERGLAQADAGQFISAEEVFAEFGVTYRQAD